MNKDRALIVGGGPVGMVAATALASKGIPVTLVDDNADVAEDLRASTFHPPTLDYLATLGVVDDMHRLGLVCPLWQFRDRRKGSIATFDLSRLKDETAFPYRLQCEQWKLTRLLRDKLSGMPDAETIFGARAEDLRQTSDGVVLTFRDAAGEIEQREGRFLIAADGARSIVRALIDMPFEGMTIPELYLSMSTSFDFQEAMPDLANIAYISDPDEWLTLLRTPTLWRVLLPTAADESDTEMLKPETLEARLQAVFHNSHPYEVIHRTRYRVHERVAKSFVHGRVLLVGDAAHLNNPLGGMGMNGGIHDAMNLAEKLSAIWRGADQSLLDRYARQRRKVAIEAVQAQALRNRQILNERDPGKRQSYYDDLKAAADDPKRHKDYLMRSSMIQSLRDAELTP